MPSLLGTLIFLAAFFVLAFNRASLLVWTISTVIGFLILNQYSQSYTLISLFFIVAVGLLVPLNVKFIRRKWISRPVFVIFKKLMPSMSSTEKEALEAGTVSFEGELFSGMPDFKKLLDQSAITLNKDEQAFVDGPVKKLCSMLDEWDITHNRCDLPPEVWQFIKDNGFLGMIIPKAYGGLEFSATAQAVVLVSIYSRSVSAASTVSVPNSLGPGELLLKYGTEEQKNHYLPRLAKGMDIPCFALTAPDAGSDAASIPDKGIVCRGTFEGKEVIGIKLNWNKRYITLSPVATVLGLAFRLFDPDGLLGNKKDIGITCALIPVETKGVVTGRRHFPLNTAFMNGPTQGKDVFIPMSYLIGGEAMAGQGWRMLMECLSAGRAISLPSGAVGGGQAAALTSGAYARVRKQFNTAIANFEGIQESLARIAANTYIVDAALMTTAASIDHGAKPAVASAIIKYHTTELSRKIALDAMDIHGGKGICLGPNNYLGRGYQNAPISITVEGANILTRCLIIYGQGAIRCHPHVLAEIESCRENDLRRFDNAFFAHGGFILSNFIRSFVLGLSDGRLAFNRAGKLKRAMQQITRYSSNLAFLSDFSMMIMGAELKRKEKISARLGDMLSTLYLASCVLKRFHDAGRAKEEWPIVKWAYESLMYQCEEAMADTVMNLPLGYARVLLKLVLMPLGRRRAKPSDKLGAKVAALLTTDNATRKRLSRFVLTTLGEQDPISQLEDAFRRVIATHEIEKRVGQAVKAGDISGMTLFEQIDLALEKKIITKQEADELRLTEKARQQVIAVDDFSSEELQRVQSGLANVTALKQVV